MSEVEETTDLVAVTDEEIETALAEFHEEDPLDGMTPAQVHVATMMVFAPDMSVQDIANKIGKSVSTIRNWQRLPSLQLYVRQQLESYAKETKSRHIERTVLLHNKLFEELADRFVTPAKTEKEFQELLGDEYTSSDKKRYLDRLAHNATFSDLMRIWGQVDKQIRLDNGEATARVEQKDFVDRTRQRFEERQVKRRRFADFMDEHPEVTDLAAIIDITPVKTAEAQAEVEVVDEEFEKEMEDIRVVLADFALED